MTNKVRPMSSSHRGQTLSISSSSKVYSKACFNYYLGLCININKKHDSVIENIIKQITVERKIFNSI